MNMKKILSLLSGAALFAAQANAALLINGAGSTFDNPAFTKWFSVYSSVDPGVNFNYQSIGSGAGKKQLQNQTVDFAASAAPLPVADLARPPAKCCMCPSSPAAWPSS